MQSSKNSVAYNANHIGNGHTSNGNKGKELLNEITDDMPVWKKELLTKKNMEILAQEQRKKEEQEAEMQKYANLPHWKAEILKRKDEEKRKQDDAERQKVVQQEMQEQEFKTKPTWQQELIKRRNSYQNTA